MGRLLSRGTQGGRFTASNGRHPAGPWRRKWIRLRRWAGTSKPGRMAVHKSELRAGAQGFEKPVHKLFTAPETTQPKDHFYNTIQCMSYGMDFGVPLGSPAPKSSGAHQRPPPSSVCYRGPRPPPFASICVQNPSTCRRQTRPPGDTLIGDITYPR